MRYPKLRELKEAIRALIKGPYTSRFPYEPHKPFERFRGRPYFYEEDCVGCTACAQVCPPKAIDYEDKKTKRVLTVHWDICIFCGQCQANCLTGKGIILSQEFDLATTENRKELKQVIEKEFVVCECCAEPIVPYDQFVWVVNRLGPLCYSNPSLLIPYLKSLNLGLWHNIPTKKEGEFSRADRMKVICPKCRREAMLKA